LSHGPYSAKANEAIENPKLRDAQIAFSIVELKQYGIVDSGDTRRLGIGATTDERVKALRKDDESG
jgi:NitT/TauT family transport system substrate-binding protein